MIGGSSPGVARFVDLFFSVPSCGERLRAPVSVACPAFSVYTHFALEFFFWPSLVLVHGNSFLFDFTPFTLFLPRLQDGRAAFFFVFFLDAPFCCPSQFPRTIFGMFPGAVPFRVGSTPSHLDCLPLFRLRHRIVKNPKVLPGLLRVFSSFPHSFYFCSTRLCPHHAVASKAIDLPCRLAFCEPRHGRRVVFSPDFWVWWWVLFWVVWWGLGGGFVRSFPSERAPKQLVLFSPLLLPELRDLCEQTPLQVLSPPVNV